MAKLCYVPKTQDDCAAPIPYITLAEAEIGKKYKVWLNRSSKEYDAEVSKRDKTHTYLKHGNGEAALPNNISIELIALRPNE